MAEIKFFGEVDIHPIKKTISSEYPAWYFTRAYDGLCEDVARLERTLARGDVPTDKIAQIKDRLEKTKERRDKIQESIPKLEGKDIDEMAKARKTMSSIIKDGYFTRSSMMKGTADAHKEAERMIKPKVDVKPEFIEYLKAANVPIVDGKVTRDGLVKAWKITGKLLNLHGKDEETDAEVLRRD